MKKWIMVVAALAVVEGSALADGFLELEGGPVIPLGDDDYDSAVETSFKLGARVGAISLAERGLSFGADVGADWTPLAHDFEGPFTSASFHRMRVLVALRAAGRVGGSGVVTARLGAGIDYARATFRILGGETTETDVGIAIDPSVAFQADLGRALIGVKIGVPIGIHDEQGDDLLDYTSVDLDILFVLTGTM